MLNMFKDFKGHIFNLAFKEKGKQCISNLYSITDYNVYNVKSL